MKLKKESRLLWKVLGIFVTGLLFGVVISCFNPIAAKADELYFDEEGNLYFNTRDKKASGGVRYATIGWIIKRHNMPLDAPEQEYVIVTKRQYKESEVDPDDSDYIFSYFWSDKDEILNAVQSVSQEWYNILTGYGENVYIDSVMTVIEDGEELGTLYVGGTYSGEVYFDFDGIANARGWASPDSLRSHFDRMVEFPQIYEPKDAHIDIIKREDIYFNTSQYISFMLGAGSYQNETFDISAGIPSGESLYIKGRADSMQAVLKLTRVTARLTEYIDVPVIYVMRWQDYYGVYQHDTRWIHRYYEVTRDFTYYEFDGIEIYDLSELRIGGSILKNDGYTDKSVATNNDIDWNAVCYGDVEAHIVGYDKSVTNTIGTMLLIGENGKKPAIPDVDYSEVAESFLGDVYVKNDKVEVDGVIVLSDDACLKNGSEPEVILSSPEANIYSEDISIATEAANGQCDDCYAELVYKSSSGKELVSKENLNSVMVHTPVYCNISVKTDKKLNQAIEPTISDVVLGEYMTVSFNDFGMHRDIKGYGLGSYSEYVGMRQVCCPFKVEYNGITYEADTWINVDGYSVKLRVMEDTKEGTYIVYARTQVYNGVTDMEKKAIEENANLSMESYGAWDAVEVRVIGKLCNLELEYNGIVYDASQMPVNVSVTLKRFTLSFETFGSMMEEDSVEINYSYYHEDEKGVLTPVDIYGVEGRNYLDGVITGKFVDNKTLSLSSGGNPADANVNLAVGNSIIWQTELELYDELLVVPKGTGAQDIQTAIKKDKMQDIALGSGSVIVCVDIVSIKTGTPYLSYINEENAKKGYCNMWLREGGTSQYPYGAVARIDLGTYTYYDYEVSGTH